VQRGLGVGSAGAGPGLAPKCKSVPRLPIPDPPQSSADSFVPTDA
jgi:hypothetical protein